MRCAWGNRDGLKSIKQCMYRRELDFETLSTEPSYELRTYECPNCQAVESIVVQFN